MYKKIHVTAIILAAMLLTSCGEKEPEVTTSFQEWADAYTADHPTEPATHTTAAAVETTEAETTSVAETKAVKVKAKDVKGYTHEGISNALEAQGIIRNAEGFFYAEIPEFGETKDIYIRAKHDEDGEHVTLTAYPYTTVALPEWGIKRFSYFPEFFPEDESKIIPLTENDYSIFELTKENAENSEMLSKSDVVDMPIIKGTYNLIEKNLPLDTVIDISALYPGSFSRKTVDGEIQIWRMEIEKFEEKEIEAMDCRQIFANFYPYRTDTFMLSDKKIVFYKDGYTYLYCLFYDLDGDWLHSGKRNENAVLSGSALFRTKDNLCEGVLLKNIDSDSGFYSDDFALNYSLIFDDIEKVTGGKLCKGLYLN